MVWSQLRTLSSGSRLCDKAPEAPNFEEEGAPGLKRWRRLCQVVLVEGRYQVVAMLLNSSKGKNESTMF